MAGIIKAESYHIQAYKYIQKSLLEKKYKPGEQITEVGLANELEISRGPIREAMRMLMQDGLFVQNGSRTFVFNPSYQDALDLYLCKERLEPLAAKLAAKNIDEDGKMELSNMLDKIENSVANEQPVEEITTYNTEFNDLILTFSKNDQLIHFMNLIRSKTIYMRNALLGEVNRRDVFLEEYRAITAAINQNDDCLAEQLMIKHVEVDLEMLKQYFENATEEE
ncbi:GntR family transcriptional regulator [Alkalibacillus salilacus]|uniref:DNA-binding GntR family transcriptional regulator n=1 Tax=Alkalibacillus salilacus TaxID=284582 RepID=A0ABT9VB21_9BACI|nr:GntR family transcriptional regulator [Alkalibacillus salilacus]MDQ0158157.1 DNA-binding GntR family transcriptional regulator [Alkalibacillus salilacus]